MKSFQVALQFLTRLPAGAAVKWDEELLARSVAYYPLVGLIVGFILCCIYWGLSKFFPPDVVAVFLVIGEIVITGGLHWDGFMDTMDGVFSGRSRERVLEIMRDSRIGAFGLLGALGLFFLKYSLLAHVPPAEAYVLLLSMPVIARINLLPSLHFFPSARPSGLGKIFAEKKDGLALTIGIISGAVIMGLAGGWANLAVGGLVVAIGWWLNRRLVSVLGGLTGDTYGALVEISEVLFIFLVQFFQGINY